MIRVTFSKHPFHCGEERQVGQGKAKKEGGCCWDAGEMMRTWEQGMELGRLRGQLDLQELMMGWRWEDRRVESRKTQDSWWYQSLQQRHSRKVHWRRI